MGFAGKVEPCFIIPTVVVVNESFLGVLSTPSGKGGWGGVALHSAGVMADLDLFIGDEGLAWKVANAYTLSYPIRHAQENWDLDWLNTSSSKMAYLVGQLKELHARNEKKMQLCTTVDILGDREFIQLGKDSSSEFMWGPQDIVQLTQNSQPEKAILFSQFLEHINVVENMP